MAANTIVVLCVQAFSIQIAFSQQCTSRAAIEASRLSSPYNMVGFSQLSPAMAYNGMNGRGLPCNEYCTSTKELIMSNGGGLPVTSVSSISPTGIIVRSDNALEGPVLITGELPFVSAIAIEGNLPTKGAGAIKYGCGSGVVAIFSEGTGPSTSVNVRPDAYNPCSNMAFDAGSNFNFGPSMCLDYGFGPATSFGRSIGFANANRLGCSNCGRGIVC